MKKTWVISYLMVLLTQSTLYAEIILDGTLGFKDTLTGPNYLLDAPLGKQVGANLFHSFSEFNLNADENITFSGPGNINNIINRVTGGNPSNINGGLYSTIPNANIYFLNPFGVVFGPNATLNIPGSFHVSTANILYLQEGGKFDATKPSNSLLTSAAPSAFGFLTNSSADLSIQGSKLSISPQNTLSIIGGQIKIDQAQVEAFSGRLNLASIVGEGQVVPEANGLTSVGERGNLTVTDSQLNVSGEAGGTVYIQAGRLVLDNSAIAAKTLGAENGHGINIDVTDLLATRGGRLSSSTSGSGNSGDINIRATDKIELSGENDQGVSGIFAESQSHTDDNSEENIGNSGNILLKTNQLNLTGGAVITTSSYSTGKGGDILITADDTVNVSGEAISKDANGSDQVSGIFAQMYTENNNPPQSGMIDIRARQLQVTEGGAISSSSFGTALAGSINLNIRDDVVVSGTSSRGNSSMIATSVWGGSATSDAGDLRLAARKLTINGGAQIQTLTSGTDRSRSGNLYMDVKDIVISGSWHLKDWYLFSGIYTLSYSGNAGDIILKTEKLNLEQGGKITAQADGTGVAGNIFIEALKGVYLSNEGNIRTESVDGHAGLIKLITPELHLKDNAKILATAKGKEPGGNIEIGVNHLHLTKGSEISANSKNQGNAGNLRFIVGDTLVLEDSSISTEAQRSEGGNITIISPGYLRLTHSSISTSVKDENGNGGNIVLQPTFIILDEGQIIAQAVSGNGGHIDIKTVGIYNFLPEPLEEFINASSKFGLDGEVKINSPDTNVTESFVMLPIGFLDVSVLLESCSRSYLKKNDSQFKVNSFSGSPPHPEDLKASPLILF